MASLGYMLYSKARLSLSLSKFHIETPRLSFESRISPKVPGSCTRPLQRHHLGASLSGTSMGE